MVSFLPNTATILPEYSESRKAWASKACFPSITVLNLGLFDPGRDAAACLDFTSTKLESTAMEVPIVPSQEGVSMSSHDIYRAAPVRIAVMHITPLHDQCHALCLL